MTKPRVLVVDDDPEIREVIGLVLDAEGLDVDYACNGADALEKLALQPRTSLILLDLMMPRMTGAELVQRLRGDPLLASVPVLVLSGDANAKEIATTLGVAGFLGKPVELAALTRAVSETLSRSPDAMPASP